MTKKKKKGGRFKKLLRRPERARVRDQAARRARQERKVSKPKGPGLLTRLSYHAKKKHVVKKHASGWTEHTYYH